MAVYISLGELGKKNGGDRERRGGKRSPSSRVSSRL